MTNTVSNEQALHVAICVSAPLINSLITLLARYLVMRFSAFQPLTRSLSKCQQKLHTAEIFVFRYSCNECMICFKGAAKLVQQFSDY